MASRVREAVMPSRLVERILDAAGTELILVGGQALKVWMDRYGVRLPPKMAFVSRDVDLLAPSAADADAVRRIARALHGRAVFPRRRAALTALVGQAVREISETEIFNVDVVHKVFGADDGIRARAVELQMPNSIVRVMHPLDVLKSRVDNLSDLPEKQNELGKAQLRAAIAITQAFLREAAKGEPASRRRPVTLRYVRFIEHVALSSAGKKVATRYGLCVADAIEPHAIASRAFREEALPRLARLMSPQRRTELGLET